MSHNKFKTELQKLVKQEAHPMFTRRSQLHSYIAITHANPAFVHETLFSRPSEIISPLFLAPLAIIFVSAIDCVFKIRKFPALQGELKLEASTMS